MYCNPYPSGFWIGFPFNDDEDNNVRRTFKSGDGGKTRIKLLLSRTERAWIGCRNRNQYKRETSSDAAFIRQTFPRTGTGDERSRSHARIDTRLPVAPKT
jgi:hypothetical protein